jgi:hypothetical protein
MWRRRQQRAWIWQCITRASYSNTGVALRLDTPLQTLWPHAHCLLIAAVLVCVFVQCSHLWASCTACHTHLWALMCTEQGELHYYLLLSISLQLHTTGWNVVLWTEYYINSSIASTCSEYLMHLWYHCMHHTVRASANFIAHPIPMLDVRILLQQWSWSLCAQIYTQSSKRCTISCW